MRRLDAVVVGGGHAGLAVSRLLGVAEVDHVVLERGRVGESWRSQRWDSLRLLTPAWLSRLPGYSFAGDDPDAYLPARAVADHLEAYAAGSGAPTRERITVLSVRRADGGFRVVTDSGSWQARHVVLASGSATRVVRPACAARLPAAVQQLDALGYRSPADVADGRVLVVGAGASGVQIADELVAAGRDVTLAVGRHTRLPRHYLGRDVLWWLDRTGHLDRTIDEMPDPEQAAREPSSQLVGAHARAVDLAALAARGVRLRGRMRAVSDLGSVVTGSELPGLVDDAQRRMHRVLAAIDREAVRLGLATSGIRPGPVRLPTAASEPAVDRYDAVVWASGVSGDHSWLHVRGVERDGRLVQHRGRTAVPGLYAVGQRFGHRRRSSLIDGARFDAADVVEDILRRDRRTVTALAANE